RLGQQAGCNGERMHFVFPLEPSDFVVQHELDVALAFVPVARGDEAGLSLRAARDRRPSDVFHLAERLPALVLRGRAFAHREKNLFFRPGRLTDHDLLALAVALDDERTEAGVAKRRAVCRCSVFYVDAHVFCSLWKREFRRFEISTSSRGCEHTSTAAPACMVRRGRCKGATSARTRVD